MLATTTETAPHDTGRELGALFRSRNDGFFCHGNNKLRIYKVRKVVKCFFEATL